MDEQLSRRFIPAKRLDRYYTATVTDVSVRVTGR
jgi:hypothetical protein